MVTERQGMFVFLVGLLFTAFGVGGVEHSITDADLVTSVIVAATGLAVMYSGTLIIQRAQ